MSIPLSVIPTELCVIFMNADEAKKKEYFLLRVLRSTENRKTLYTQPTNFSTDSSETMTDLSSSLLERHHSVESLCNTPAKTQTFPHTLHPISHKVRYLVKYCYCLYIHRRNCVWLHDYWCFVFNKIYYKAVVLCKG